MSEEEKIVAVEDERQLQHQGEGGSTLDSELVAVAADESEPAALAKSTEIPPASRDDLDRSPENDGGQQEGDTLRLASEPMIVAADEAELMAIAETTEGLPANSDDADQSPENGSRHQEGEGSCLGSDCETEPMVMAIPRRPPSVVTNMGFEAIWARLEDPESEPAETSRLITLEIARATKSMLSRRFTVEDGYIIKGYAQQVKALRELDQQLLQAEVWRRKQDILNFEGERFKFVLGKVVDLFVQAMKEAGVPDDLRPSVMMNYRDLMAVNEPLIRRETENLGANKTS
jgi:hypothetical protein